MKIVVNNHVVLSSKSDVHYQHRTPIWEVEIQSDVLNTPEFEAELRDDNNFELSVGHRSKLRSVYNGTGVVSEFLQESCQEFLLNLINRSQHFRGRYNKTLDQYRQQTTWFANILRDQPGFAMTPHIDNNHVMVQMVVNLLQDNNTSTEFYHASESEPCYRAPVKKNHGVAFLNTPGSIHSISNINQTRWILYCGLLV